MTTLPEMSRKVYEAMADNEIIQVWAVVEYKWKLCEVIIEHIYDEWVEFDLWNTDDNEIDRFIEHQEILLLHPPFMRIWDVLDYIQQNNTKYMSSKEIVVNKRPKDHLSKSIPLDPDESRRPLLEFLSSLIE